MLESRIVCRARRGQCESRRGVLLLGKCVGVAVESQLNRPVVSKEVARLIDMKHLAARMATAPSSPKGLGLFCHDRLANQGFPHRR